MDRLKPLHLWHEQQWRAWHRIQACVCYQPTGWRTVTQVLEAAATSVFISDSNAEARVALVDGVLARFQSAGEYFCPDT